MLFADAYELCRPISDERVQAKVGLSESGGRRLTHIVSFPSSGISCSVRRPFFACFFSSSSSSVHCFSSAGSFLLAVLLPRAASSRLLRVDAKIPANLIYLATIPPQHKRKGRIFHSQQQNEHIVLLQPTPNSHPRPFGSSGRHNCRIAFFVRRWSSRCVLVRPTLDTAVSQIISHCSARLLGRWRRSATSSSHVDPRRSASPRSNVQQ